MSSLRYPDHRKIWNEGLGDGLHVYFRMLLTYNCLPANAGLVEFSNTYAGCTLDVREKADSLKHIVL